jgi:hypothetical protein
MICPQMSQNTQMSVSYLWHQRNLREFSLKIQVYHAKKIPSFYF